MTRDVDIVFDNYIKARYPLLVITGEQRERIRHAFYMGMWGAMGLGAQANKLPNHEKTKLIAGVYEQVERVVYDGKRGMTKPKEFGI